MATGLSNWGGRRVRRATALPFLLLVTMAGSSGFQKPESGSFRISVDVALVVLQAAVTNRQGEVVSDLGAQNFEVYEDGVLQDIRLFHNEDIPVTVGLVVDRSSTMRPKMVEVYAATRTFARSSNPEDSMFVVNFNEKVSLGLGPGQFTNSSLKLEQAIGTVLTGGQTALYDAVATGLEELRAGKQEKKVLIVVSDGGDNASTRNLGQVMHLAGESNAVIYTIGIFDQDDPERNPGVLKRLARESGGEAFFPEQLSEVPGICERIAHDIRHQYTIGYVPSKPTHEGDHRSIRVMAQTKDHERLAVRTRNGYIAGGKLRVPTKSEK